MQRRPWITLRRTSEDHLSAPAVGVTEAREWVGIGSVAVHAQHRALVDTLGWTDLNVDTHRTGFEGGHYRPADLFYGWEDTPLGINLVIDQDLKREGRRVWHLHPDVQIALGLLREGNIWYRPDEGWREAARISFDLSGMPSLLEIHAELLADYLAARGMALFLSSYRERTAVFEAAPPFAVDDPVQKAEGRDVRELCSLEDWDAPPGSVTVRGALWRTEWFDPGALSIRVKGDTPLHPISFAKNASGERATPAELKSSLTWLHFAPDLVSDLLRYRGATLMWHSADTGSIGATSETLHFGVNDAGLINVLAKDIGNLPPWEQRVWAAHNLNPDTPVSQELFATQMQALPAPTVAPESRLRVALMELDEAFYERTGARLLRPHAQVEALLTQANRFRASGPNGVPALAKDLSHLFVVAGVWRKRWCNISNLEADKVFCIGVITDRSNTA